MLYASLASESVLWIQPGAASRWSAGWVAPAYPTPSAAVGTRMAN